MSDFGVFESASASSEPTPLPRSARRKNAAAAERENIAKAASDIKRQFGSFLANAQNPREFNERWASLGNRIPTTIAAYTFPRPAVIRKVKASVRPTFDSTKVATQKAAWKKDANTGVYVLADRETFSCPSCGTRKASLGMSRCACGKTWNSWSINKNGQVSVLCVEVPERRDAILASRKKVAKTPYEKAWELIYDCGDRWPTQEEMYQASEEEGFEYIDDVEAEVDKIRAAGPNPPPVPDSVRTRTSRRTKRAQDDVQKAQEKAQEAQEDAQEAQQEVQEAQQEAQEEQQKAQDKAQEMLEKAQASRRKRAKDEDDDKAHTEKASDIKDEVVDLATDKANKALTDPTRQVGEDVAPLQEVIDLLDAIIENEAVVDVDDDLEIDDEALDEAVTVLEEATAKVASYKMNKCVRKLDVEAAFMLGATNPTMDNPFKDKARKTAFAEGRGEVQAQADKAVFENGWNAYLAGRDVPATAPKAWLEGYVAASEATPLPDTIQHEKATDEAEKIEDEKRRDSADLIDNDNAKVKDNGVTTVQVKPAKD